MTSLKRVTIDGDLSIAYETFEPEDSIDNPVTFVCFPGMGDSRKQYRFLAPILAKNGHSVVAADLRGHGDSSRGFKEYTPESVAEDYVRVVAQVSGRVVLVGNSFAGAAAVIAATKIDAARLAGVVLLGPVLRPSSADKFFYPLTYVLFNGLWGKSAWLSYYQTLYVKKPDDFADYIKNLRIALDGSIHPLACIGRASKAHAESVLTGPAYAARTLAVYGDKDPDFPIGAVKEAAWLESVLNGKGAPKVSVYNEVSHYPHVEQPDRVAAEIIDFIKQQ